MARIKVLEYTFENETIKIPVNVSVNGVFSCSIPHLMAQKLGLEKNDLLGSKLSDVEDVLNSAFYEYKQRSTKTRMMVAISFKATRNFMKKEIPIRHLICSLILLDGLMNTTIELVLDIEYCLKRV